MRGDKNMEHYSVDFCVRGFKSVEAGSKEEAKKLIDEINFGELEEINSEVSDFNLDDSVDFRIWGYKKIQVEAENEEEATNKAKKLINEVDFGELEEIETEVIDVDFDINYDNEMEDNKDR